MSRIVNFGVRSIAFAARAPLRWSQKASFRPAARSIVWRQIITRMLAADRAGLRHLPAQLDQLLLQAVDLLLLPVDREVELVQQVVGEAGLDLQFVYSVFEGSRRLHGPIGQDAVRAAPTLAAMRRWLCVLLLALLPLQFSWAAVVGYCAHEANATAPHLGHHQHAHEDASLENAATSASADAGGTSAPSALDLDCGHCHGLGVVVSVPVAGPPTLRALHHAAPWPARGLASHPTAPPDRPQWPPLA